MKILSFLDKHFEEIVGALSLALVVILIFWGVLLRVFFSSGIPWQEELSRILFVFMVFIGASYGVQKHEHIRVTLVRDALPERYKIILDIFADLAWIIFNLLVVYYAIDNLIGPMSNFIAHSAYLGLDLRIPFSLIPLLLLLQTFRLLQLFYRTYIKKNKISNEV